VKPNLGENEGRDQKGDQGKEPGGLVGGAAWASAGYWEKGGESRCHKSEDKGVTGGGGELWREIQVWTPGRLAKESGERMSGE